MREVGANVLNESNDLCNGCQLESRQELALEIDQTAKLQSSFHYETCFTRTDEERLIDIKNHSIACQDNFDSNCELCCMISKLESDVTRWSKNVENTVDKKWNQDYRTDMDTFVQLLYSEDLDIASHKFLLVSLQRRINFFYHVNTFYRQVLSYWRSGQILSAKMSLWNLKRLIKSEMYICIHCYKWEKAVNFLFADMEHEKMRLNALF